MGSFLSVHGRGVRVKRVASLCGVGVITLIIAGCSASGQRHGYYGAYGTTGSVPVPSEPVYGYGYRNGYGGSSYTSSSGYYGSSGYSGASDYGGAYYRASESRAPFSAGGYSDYGKTSVQRTALAPVSGHASDAGSTFAMQPVSDTTATSGSSSGGQRLAYDYRTKNGGYSSDGRYDSHYGDDGDRRRFDAAAARGEYEVEAGDTLYSIAQRFRMTTADLMDLNGLTGPDIRPGQRLRLSRTSGAAPASRERPPYRDSRGYDYSYDSSRYKDGGRGYNGDRDDRAGRSDDDGRGYDKGRDTYDSRRNSYANGRNTDADDRDNYASRRDSYAGRRRGYDGERASAPGHRPPASDYAGYDGRRDRGNSISYSVKRGDTLFDIARRNGISHRELADYNDIPVTATLYPGQVLHIPRGRGYDWGVDREGDDGRRGELSKRRGQPAVAGRAPEKAATRVAAVKRGSRTARPMTAASVRVDAREGDVVVTGGPASRTSSARVAPAQLVAAAHQETSAPASGGARMAARECESLLANPAQRTAKTFREPVQGAIISKYGSKEDGSFNDGINFSVPKGTPVKAAENGVVAYAGDELAGFGNLILIRHADGFVTAYAHNDQVLVKRCDVVKRGQTISKAGASGNAAKPQLHFELRKDSKPVDPEAYFAKS